MTDTDQTQTKPIRNDKQDKSPHRRRYPQYHTIEVGESFAYGEEVTSSSSYAFARDASIKLGKKFRVSKVGDGYRCWRLR